LPVKIFYVDRFTHYTTQIFTDLQKIISNNKNYEILFIGPQKNNDKSWLSENTIKGEKRVWRYGHYIGNLYNFIKQEQPDIVHISFEWRMFGPRMATLKLPLLLLLLRVFTRTKIILSLHPATLSKENSKWIIMKEALPPKIPRFLFDAFVKFFIKSLCNLSHKIIADTFLQKSGLTEFYKINPEKIFVAPLIFPPSNVEINFEKKKKFDSQFYNKKIILCFGVISPRKSIHTIIKAFANISDKIQDHVLVIAGMTTDDYKPYEKMLRNLVSQYNLENQVFFTGYIDDEETEILFDLAKIAFYVYYPSADAGGSVFYAIYHKVPCIVSTGGYFDELFSKDDALFVEYDDENHLSKAILELSTNADLKSRLHLKMDNFSKKISTESTAIGYFDVYKKTIKL
jgi:glycosyltransferase involved in cell wall biosynthesis